MSAIDTLNNLKKQYEDACKELGGQYLKEALQLLWDACPTLEAVCWTQYTPYFNDGDACEFRVNSIGSGLFAGGPEVDEGGESWDSGWNGNLWFSENYTSVDEAYYAERKALAPALAKTNAAFDSNEEMLRQMFGDHAKVLAYRDGRVVVEEYDHG